MAWFHRIGSDSRLHRIAGAMRKRGLVEGYFVEPDQPGALLVDADSAELHDVLRNAQRNGTRILIAFIGRAALDPWPLLEAGAEDFVRLDSEHAIDQLVARLNRWCAVEQLVESDAVREMAIGRSAAWKRSLRQAVELAHFTSSPILITGDTGTGKELIARLVHELDSRSSRGELVLVDCTVIVESLSGSEFFGHEKGAFTGASSPRVGAFALADGGTLFLDEVGELPLAMQPELLRVIQEGMYKPVGGNRWHSTAFRLIAATNRDLIADQTDGNFRSDLYFRLAASMVHLPPLRERVDDIVPLFKHFFSEASGKDIEAELEPAVAQLLESREYPGNVRDLRQVAMRAAARHVGPGLITPGDIHPADRAFHRSATSDGHAHELNEDDNLTPILTDAVRAALADGVRLKELKEMVAEMATSIALEETGNVARAADRLGISTRAINYRRSNGKRDDQLV
jgi:transcriptional regulator with GAF, ATPase, and Fis domain